MEVVPPGAAIDVSWDGRLDNTAIFDNYRGTGTVTIAGGTVIAKGVVFNNTLGNASTGYLITDGGFSSNTLTLSDATPTITAYANATIQAGINTQTGLTKNGTGSLTLSAFFNPQYSGTTTINGGVLNITSNSSIGTGSVVVNGSGALEISNQSLGLATAAGATFTAGGGSLILNNSPTVAVRSFTRNAGGGLVIVPNSSTALGSNERVTSTGTVTLVNGIADASFVAQKSATDSTGDFLTYGANGFARAIYSTATSITNGVSGGTSSASVFHATTTTNNTFSAASTLYGLKVDANVTVGGSFTLGDGTHTAGLILNSNVAVPRNTINGSVIFKTGSEGAIYVGGNPASGVPYALIGAVLGSNGMTKSGAGTLELANAQYTGATTINQGTVIFDGATNTGLNAGTRQSSVINLAGTALYTSTGFGVRSTINLIGDGTIGSGDGFNLPFLGTVYGNGHELNITNTQTYGSVVFNGTAYDVSQFNVNYGVLQIGAALGNTNAPIVVTDGPNSANSELVITAGAFVANDIVLNQGSLGGGGNSGTSTVTGSLTLTNAGGNVVTQGGNLVLEGSIQGSSPLIFQSLGGGATISGKANTYTGPTEVVSGKLTVTGSIASSSSVQVGAGVPSTALLTGNGATSQVNLEGGGKLAPGLSGAGTMTATGLKG